MDWVLWGPALHPSGPSISEIRAMTFPELAECHAALDHLDRLTKLAQARARK